MVDTALLWIILGGFMEPVWVLALKRYDDTHRLAWAVLAIIFMIASPMCLSFAMKTMPVGVSYAIWTGLGAIFTLVAGTVVYHEKVDRIKVLLVFMIVVGVAGLQLTSEAGL